MSGDIVKKGTEHGRVFQYGKCGACGCEFEVYQGRDVNRFTYVDISKPEDENGFYSYVLCLDCSNLVLRLLNAIEKNNRR